MSRLIVDFITSLDGYASAEGWPGWWGLESPGYLAWLDERPDRDYTVLMGANTYRLMSAFASSTDLPEEEAGTMADLTRQRKIVFSSTLDTPLAWANTEVVRGDAVEAVAELKRSSTNMSTIGSLTLCRSLLEAGLVDLFRVGVFPVITGKTGRERIYDGYPDVMLDMVTSRTFDDRILLLEYAPRVIDGPPGVDAGS
jgi:dihydrofolate reductase